MKTKAIFYHAGCPVCVNAEAMVANMVDRERFDVEMVHLGEDKSRIPEAENFGVRSVPALAVEGNAFHINYGAGIDDLK